MMKRAREAGRRILASFMIVLTLSFTVIGDYMMPPVETEAAAATSVVLMALIEAVMGSIGLTFSTQADLKECADGFQYGIDNGLEYQASNGVEIFSKIKDFLLAPNKTVDQDTLAALQEALYNQSAGKMSFSSDVSSSVSMDRVVVSSNTSVTVPCIRKSTLDYSAILFGSKARSDQNVLSTDQLSQFFVFISRLRSTGDIECSAACTSDGFYGMVYDHASGDIKFYDRFGQSIYLTGYSSSRSSSYDSSTDSYYTSYVKQVPYLSDEHRSSYHLCQYSYFSKIMFYVAPGVRIFNSYASLKNSLLLGDYAPTSPVYGLSSSAGTKPFTKNEDGSLTLKDLEPSITKAVESAVNTAIAANPSITDADLNAMVSEILASNTEIKDEIKDDIGESTSFLAGILSEIKTLVKGNATSISSLSDQVTAVQDSISKIGSTDGSSALKEPVESIADQFTVIDGTGGDTGGDGDKNHEPDVWAVGPVTSIKLLQPLFSFLGKPLQIITNSLRQIWTQITEIPGNIDSALHEWVFPALESQLSKMDNLIRIVGDGFKSLPDTLSAALADIKVNVPDISIPDINIPEPINYTNSFSRIIELLESFFVIDTAALSDAASGFNDVWADKFPFGSRLNTILGGFTFSDNFNYPVIKMETPDILKQFYPNDYIVLCDFAQFKTQCIWVRNLCRCLLWFSFALSFINHLRTQFHVG